MKLLEVDTGKLEKAKLLELLPIEIYEARGRLNDKVIANLLFEQIYLVMDGVTRTVFGSPTPLAILSGAIREDYNMYKQRYSENVERVEAAMYRKLFVDTYQAFEIFIAEIVSALFFAFPKLLGGPNELSPVLNVGLGDVFDRSDVIEIRCAVIERKVKSILQADNISDVIHKIERTFGLNFEVPKDTMDSLLLASLKRNLLVHNEGVINEIFRGLIAKHRLKLSSVKLGDSLAINSREVNEVSGMMRKLADGLVGVIHTRREQLWVYHAER